MTQEATVLRAALKRISIVIGLVVVLMSSTSMAYAKVCSPFGCSPEQGNLINELGGMVVTGAIVAMVLFGFARRYVK
jgi:hypothetical protein